MKKKLFLVIAIVAVLACLFAISVSAAEPNYNGEKVTLDDGTECPLWDTEGNPLIWYVESTTTEKDENDKDVTKKHYNYIDATLLYNAENRKTECVDYNCGYTDETDGVRWYQVKTITITRADGSTYGNSTFVVVNMKSDKILTTSGKATGQPITAFTKMFGGNSKTYTLEYFYLPLCTVYLKGENFKNCNALKYVNLAELKELKTVGSQDFNGCPKLFDGQIVDLTNTKLNKIENNGFSTVPAKEFIFPSTLTSINQCFASCSKLEKITFNGDLTYISPGFNYCSNLVEIVGADFSIISGIGNNSFRDCKKLVQVDGFIENGVMIIPEGIKSVGSQSFENCYKLTYVEFPSTFETVNQWAFQNCTGVKLFNLDKVDARVNFAIENGESYTTLLSPGCGPFQGCTSLVAISFPEGMTEMANRIVANCTNLTAVYMPDSVVTLKTNGNGQGPFCKSPNMYFVDEPFTVGQCLVNGEIDLSKLVLPEKPDVYFMPSGLTTISGHTEENSSGRTGSLFTECRSINDVLVFPETFVNFNAARSFNEMSTSTVQKTVVFLGDLEKFVTPTYARYTQIVFANENDKSLADLGIVRVNANNNRGDKYNTGSYMYFCANGTKCDYSTSSSETADATAISNYLNALVYENAAYHVRNPEADDSTDATCVTPELSYTFCFCGVSLNDGKPVETAPALGHTSDLTVVGWNYNGNYFANACLVHVCTVCTVEYDGETVENSALFESLGYSASEDDATGITYEVYANVKKIAEFKEYDPTAEIYYGIVVSAAPSANPLTYAGGKVTNGANTVKIDMSTTDYNKITTKITNLPESITLNCSGYVCVDGVISYLNHNTSDDEAFVVSHAAIIELLNPKTEEAPEEIPAE